MSHKIYPIKLARAGQTLFGQMPLNKLERASQIIMDSSKEQKLLEYHLDFGIDEQGCYYIVGTTAIVATLVCQRCLEPFSQTIKLDFNLSPVHTQAQAKALPVHYEPIFLEADSSALCLQSLLDEEVLLSLPLVALHDPTNSNCKLDIDSKIMVDNAKTTSPFALLKNLKIN
jgi:uncharacterized protein